MIISSMQGVDPDIRPRETTLDGIVLSGEREKKSFNVFS